VSTSPKHTPTSKSKRSTGRGRTPITKKELIGSALIKEIVSIRIDSLAKLLDLHIKGRLPGIHDEGATGDLDNKGALFIPGGLVFEDSDRQQVQREKYPSRAASAFRKTVRDCMQNDNATLLFPDGFQAGVNLDNGFFAEMSAQVLATRKAARQRPRTLESRPPQRIISDAVCRSQCPETIPRPYGARTKVGSCVAVCLVEPRLYHTQYRNEYALSGAANRRAWERIRSARQPVQGKSGDVLAPPYIVVCHQTRYGEHTLGGITRILGIGAFGEFATITLDVATRELVGELADKKVTWGESEIIAMCNGQPVLGVIRLYPRTSPGARSRGSRIMLISPREDLGIDVRHILRKARKRYLVTTTAAEQ
jgi:hypothetical protein